MVEIAKWSFKTSSSSSSSSFFFFFKKIGLKKQVVFIRLGYYHLSLVTSEKRNVFLQMTTWCMIHFHIMVQLHLATNRKRG